MANSMDSREAGTPGILVPPQHRGYTSRTSLRIRYRRASLAPEMPAPQCWFGRFGAPSLAFLGSREKHSANRPMILRAHGARAITPP